MTWYELRQAAMRHGFRQVGWGRGTRLTGHGFSLWRILADDQVQISHPDLPNLKPRLSYKEASTWINRNDWSK